MNRATLLLFAGIIGFALWLILCLTNPWIGFIMSLCCFVGLVGFIILTLICYRLAVRGETRARSL